MVTFTPVVASLCSSVSYRSALSSASTSFSSPGASTSLGRSVRHSMLIDSLHHLLRLASRNYASAAAQSNIDEFIERLYVREGRG